MSALDLEAGVIVEVFNPEQPFEGVIVQLPELPIFVDLGGGGGFGGGDTGGGGDVPEVGTTQLNSGQSFKDVTFAVPKPSSTWKFKQLVVVNLTDPNPLNIWAGIVTNKTTGGFTVQLNGEPDTDNYFLHWE